MVHTLQVSNPWLNRWRYRIPTKGEDKYFSIVMIGNKYEVARMLGDMEDKNERAVILGNFKHFELAVKFVLETK